MLKSYRFFLKAKSNLMNIAAWGSLAIGLLFMNSCDLHMGPTYKAFPMGKIRPDSVYCYHIGWGIDNGAYYVSFKKGVCAGFDTAHDICYGRGEYEIYYLVTKDTLHLFSGPGRVYVPFSLRNRVCLLADSTENVTGNQIYRAQRIPIDTNLARVKDADGRYLLKEVIFDTVTHEMPCDFRYDTLSRGMVIQ